MVNSGTLKYVQIATDFRSFCSLVSFSPAMFCVCVRLEFNPEVPSAQRTSSAKKSSNVFSRHWKLLEASSSESPKPHNEVCQVCVTCFAGAELTDSMLGLLA